MILFAYFTKISIELLRIEREKQGVKGFREVNTENLGHSFLPTCFSLECLPKSWMDPKAYCAK